VSLSYDGARPSPLWLGLAERLGAMVTDTSNAEVGLAIRLCLQRAKASTCGLGEALTPRIKVDCGTLAIGGGDVDIYIPTAAERQ
jgi:hypothetical protein